MNGGVDPAIQEKLQEFDSRRRRLVLLRGICSILVVLLGGLLIVSLLDYSVFLSDTVRLGMSATVYGATVLIAIRMLVIPFWRRPDRKTLAYMIETLEPELREDLISAVELGERKNAIDSEAFRKKLQEQVGERVKPLDIVHLLPTTYIRSWLFGAGVVTLVLISLFFVPDLHFEKLLIRAVHPGANVGRVSDVTVHIRSPNPAEPLVPYGDRVPLRVDVDGAEPKSITLQTVEPGEDLQSTNISRSGDGSYETTIRTGRKPIRYRIQASTARTRYYRITTTSRPRVKQFTRVYHPPEYTNVDRHREVGDEGTIRGIQGGSVELSIKTSEPVTSGYLKIEDEENNQTKKVDLDQTSETVLTTTLPLKKAGTYRVHLVSKRTGFDNRFTPLYEIQPEPDRLPTVTLDNPPSAGETVRHHDLPWTESFDELEDGTGKDTGNTAWTVDTSIAKSGADMSVKDGRFRAENIGTSNGNTNDAGIWETKKIDIEGAGPVHITMDVSGGEPDGNGLDDQGSAKDALRLYYRVNGGTYQRFANVSGKPDKQKLETSGITGRTLQLKVEASNTGPSEYYAWDNVSVTPERKGIISEANTGDSGETDRRTFTRSVNDVVHLTGRAEDDVGLKSVDRLIRINGETWRKKPLAEHAGKRYEVDHLLNLYSLGVENGDQLSVKLVATDLRGSAVESRTLRIEVRGVSTETPYLNRLSLFRQFQNALDRWGQSIRELRDRFDRVVNDDVSEQSVSNSLTKARNRYEEVENAAQQLLMENNSVMTDSVAVELARVAGFVHHTLVRPIRQARSGTDGIETSSSTGQLREVYRVLKRTADDSTNAVRSGRRMVVSRATGVALTELRRAIRRHRRLISGWTDLQGKQQKQNTHPYVRPLTDSARRLRTIEHLFGHIQESLPERVRKPVRTIYRTIEEQRTKLAEELKKEHPDQQVLLELTKRNRRLLSRGYRILKKKRPAISKRERKALTSVYERLPEPQVLIRDLRAVLQNGTPKYLNTAVAGSPSLKAYRNIVQRQLDTRSTLEEWRSSGSLKFSSDADLAARALEGIFNMYEARSERASALDDIRTAVQVLETGHRAMENRLGANQLSDDFDVSFSSEPHALLYQSSTWNWWKNRLQSLPRKIDRIKVWQEQSATFDALSHEREMVKLDGVMRKRARTLSAVGAPGKRMRPFQSLLNSTVESLNPRMETARETLRKFVPDLHEKMEQLAGEVRDQTESTKEVAEQEDETNIDKESVSQLSEAQRQLNEQIQDLQKRLRRDANAQDLMSETGRERARDDDAATEMLEQSRSDVNAKMRQAQASRNPSEQQERLQQAAEEQEELSKQLAQLSEHYENRSKNQNVEQTRRSLRQSEKELGIQNELANQYELAQKIAELASADSEQLAGKAQQLLQESPELQRSIEQMSEQMVASARQSLESAAEQQESVSEAVQNAAAQQQDQASGSPQANSSPSQEGQSSQSSDRQAGSSGQESGQGDASSDQQPGSGLAQEAGEQNADQTSDASGQANAQDQPSGSPSGSKQGGQQQEASSSSSGSQQQTASSGSDQGGQQQADAGGQQADTGGQQNSSSGSTGDGSSSQSGDGGQQQLASSDQSSSAQQTASGSQSGGQASSSGSASSSSSANSSPSSSGPSDSGQPSGSGQETASSSQGDGTASGEQQSSSGPSSAQASSDGTAGQSSATGQDQSALAGEQQTVAPPVEQASEALQAAAKQQEALGNKQQSKQLQKAADDTGAIASEQIPEAASAIEQNPAAAKEPVRQVEASIREQAEQLPETVPSDGAEQTGSVAGRAGTSSAPGDQQMARALSDALTGTGSPDQTAQQAASAQASNMQHQRLRSSTSGPSSAGTAMAGTSSQQSGPSGQSTSSQGKQGQGQGQTASSQGGERWNPGSSTTEGGSGASGAPAVSSPPPTGELSELEDLDAGDWGHLPEKLQDELMKSQNESVSGEYQESIRAYFRAIAEQSKKQE